MKFRTLVSQIGKPRTVAEALADKTPGEIKALAGKFGVSVRTVQKWKSGHGRKVNGVWVPQEPGKKVGGAKGVLKRLDTPANRRKIAANAVRNAQGASVGRVPVIDKSPRGKAKFVTTYRNVGAVRFDNADSRQRLNAAADAIDRKDYARAEELLSEAVLRAPDKDYGSALSIEDWPAGFHLM